jgi:hypothetical protein
MLGFTNGVVIGLPERNQRLRSLRLAFCNALAVSRRLVHLRRATAIEASHCFFSTTEYVSSMVCSVLFSHCLSLGRRQLGPWEYSVLIEESKSLITLSLAGVRVLCFIPFLCSHISQDVLKSLMINCAVHLAPVSRRPRET